MRRWLMRNRDGWSETGMTRPEAAPVNVSAIRPSPISPACPKRAQSWAWPPCGRVRAFGVLAGACILLAGCATQFGDRHFFAVVDPTTQKVVNIFRVTVRGDAALANSRYVSGFYDERAVDLFFNEVKSTDLPADVSRAGVEPIFGTVDCTGKTDAECQTAKDKALQTVPIGVDAGRSGAFVLILSTNADAIAGTIGAFAESQQVVQSAMYLANAPRRRQAATYQATADTVDNLRGASITEISSLLAAADAASPGAAKEQLYLATLHAAAAGLDPSAPPAFTTIAEARAWFAAHPRGARP